MGESSPHGRATVRAGAMGVSSLRAASAEAAFEAWGRLDARNRFFQMDLARRAAGGRLAELFGPVAVDFDREQRRLPLTATAGQAHQRLPAHHRGLLDAYTRGVNHRRGRPPRTMEHLLLRVRPQPWLAADSLLVLLRMYQQLALDIDGQRMRATLRATLPAEVVEFLLPRGDEFSAEPDHGRPIPLDALVDVLAATAALPERSVVQLFSVGGSNCWAIGGQHTAAGTPILANDMHLALGVPNTFQRIDVAYPGGRGVGFAIPGVPLLVSGSNGAVAWGLANIPADCTRLVPLPADATLTARSEQIEVRAAPTVTMSVTDSELGPVLAEPVAGRQCALQWVALWPEATNLAWLDLLGAASADEAAAIAHRTGGPPVAVIFADSLHIVQTVAGRFPRPAGAALYREFVSAQCLPLRRDPADGVLIWTNDPPLLGPGQVEVGDNYPASYRRYRIQERLLAGSGWTEADVFAVQYDNRAQFYDFYRDQALALAPRLPGDRAAEVRDCIEAWDGNFGPDSLGVALLVEFRRLVLEGLMARLLRACAAADPAFRYSWRNPEPVLRALLRQRPAALATYLGGDWVDFLAGRLAAAADELSSARPLRRTRWRDFLTVTVAHPLGGTRWTRWLNHPPIVPDGGLESVAAYGPGHGPVQRLVVRPGAENEGIAQMPGGQSGRPLSKHYRDHHRHWRAGRPLPLLPRPDAAWTEGVRNG